jgi:hypothetical protein
MPLFKDKRNNNVSESNPHYDYKVQVPGAKDVFKGWGGNYHSGHESWFNDKKSATKFAKRAGGMGYSPNVTKHDRNSSSAGYAVGKQAKSANLAVGIHKFFKGR